MAARERIERSRINGCDHHVSPDTTILNRTRIMPENQPFYCVATNDRKPRLPCRLALLANPSTTPVIGPALGPNSARTPIQHIPSRVPPEGTRTKAACGPANPDDTAGPGK